MTPIAQADVRFKLTQLGTVTDEFGYFDIKLEKGKYELYVSAKGYQSYHTELVIDRDSISKTILLQYDQKQIEEVNVSAKQTDISKSIIRKVIEEQKKSTLLQYSVDATVLSRSVEDTTLTRKNLSKKEKAKLDSSSADLIDRSIGEALLHITRALPSEFKESRQAVKIRGDKESLFYLSAIEGEFDFSKNMMYEPGLGETPFLSPFCSNGLLMYNFKFIALERDSFGEIYHIKFWPNSISNNLMTGEVWIAKDLWKVLKIKASFPDNLTPEYKKFEITAEYDEIDYNIYLPITFDFEYVTVQKPKYNGHTEVRFENYKLDSVVDRKKFSTMRSQTLQEAYEKDSTFWDQNRIIPLSDEDLVFIQRHDSIKNYHESSHYKDSLEHEHNKITLLNIIWHGQRKENWRNETRWYFPALPELIDPLAPGGIRISPGISYYKKFANKKELRVFPRISYGTLNHDWNYRISAYSLIDPIRRTRVYTDVGKGFDNIFWQDAFVNVFSRRNFYLRNRVNMRTYTEVLNGLQIGLQGQWARRRSIHDYKFYDWWDEFTNPDSSFDNTPVAFDPYNAMFATFSVEYTPRQMYVMEPYEKIILGSKWPTFFVSYKKGLKGILGSIIDYDYLETGLKQKINLAAIGILQYNAFYGNFLNENNVELVDYKRIARGNQFIFYNPMNSFQNMDSTFSLFRGFVEGHARHDFNGFLLSKIPYASKLKMTEVVGLSLLHAPERDLQYVELFLGLEKIITLFDQRIKLGLFGVKAFNNTFPSPAQIKVGISLYDSYTNSWN